MATTTNYSFPTPDDTDLVKDGASAIRSFGTAVDTQIKDLSPGTTAGDIDYYTTSTAKARVGIGTNGQILTSDGTVPSWQTPASAGGMTSIASGSLSGTSVVISSIPATYNSLILRVFNASVSTGGGSALMVRINGTTSADYQGTFLQSNSTTITGYTARTGIWANGTTVPTGTTNILAEWYYPSYASTCSKPVTVTTVRNTDPADFGCWMLTSFTAAITDLTILCNNGNTFDDGTYVLYGVK